MGMHVAPPLGVGLDVQALCHGLSIYHPSTECSLPLGGWSVILAATGDGTDGLVLDYTRNHRDHLLRSWGQEHGRSSSPHSIAARVVDSIRKVIQRDWQRVTASSESLARGLCCSSWLRRPLLCCSSSRHGQHSLACALWMRRARCIWAIYLGVGGFGGGGGFCNEFLVITGCANLSQTLRLTDDSFAEYPELMVIISCSIHETIYKLSSRLSSLLSCLYLQGPTIWKHQHTQQI